MTTVVPRESPPHAEPQARFRDLVAAEWIKMWSLRSTIWALVIGALFITGVNVNAAYEDYRHWQGWDAEQRAAFFPGTAMEDAFTDAASLALMLAAATLGAIAVIGEYGTGMIRTTFAAVPARRSVMAAKMVVTTTVTTVFAGIVAVVSFGVTQAILSGRHVGLSIGHPGVPRALVSSVLLASVCALVGLAFGAVIRHSASTLVTTFAVLLLLPMAVGDDHHWTATVNHTLPWSAWHRLIRVDGPPVDYPWTITGAWTVYALWSLVAVILTVTTVHHRDQ
jgi:ABC-2 type transport system permease protein